MKRQVKGLRCLFGISVVFLMNLILWSSCANQGMGPEGGPRDSIPPEVVNSTPKPFQTNVKGNQIDLDFNEFVVPEKLSEKLVVSPPLAQKPTIKTKGRSIQVKFNEDLIPERTYSVDFKDGIKDFREGNPMKDFRMIFSTYDKLDTLRISGLLLDAFTLLPVENALMSLYSVESDSAFMTLRPDFIARTSKEGAFLFDNLAAEHFRLFALVDEDNNLFFSKASEAIAFNDSLYLPKVTKIVKTDTLITETDTTIVEGSSSQFEPEDIILLLYTEKGFNQYLSSYKRVAKEKMQFIFSESVSDTFKISLVNRDSINDWNYLEYSLGGDTVDVWITEPSVINTDTLTVQLAYTVTDSVGNYFTKLDTLKMIDFNANQKRSKKADDDEEEILPVFSFSTNLKSNEFDLNLPIEISSPDPIDSINTEGLKLESFVNDSTLQPEPYSIVQVPDSKRKYILQYKPKEMTGYRLSIDSGLVHSYYGIPNAKLQTRFTTQKAEYYGSLILRIEGLENNGILQVLRNSEKEELVWQIEIKKGENDVIINYLKPEKYRLKLIDDVNGDGSWTTGNLLEKRQPEPVYYFPKVLKVKSNWEQKETWLVEPGKIVVKKIADEEQPAINPSNTNR